MHHWEVGRDFPLDRGLLGVRLFFVLSGFLITGILLSGPTTTFADKLRFAKAFYWRRALRIAPIFYATLAVLWVLDVAGVRGEAHWHAAYLSNFLVAKYNAWVGLPSHFWSLAVEEQFYLLWPWLILFAPRRARLSIVCTTIIIGALWRSMGVHFGLRKFALLYLLPGCLDSLGVGALFALVHREYATRVRLLRASSLVLGAGVLLVASVMTSGAGATPLSHTIAGLKGTGYALLMGAIVSACASPSGVWVRALSLRPLRYLGRVSYAVYLVHPLLWIALLRLWPSLTSRPAQWVVATVLTLTVAELSRRYFEGPINAKKKLFAYSSERNTDVAA